MIGYTTVGTNDFAKAAAFYDALFAELGAKRIIDFGEFVMWGTDPRKPMFSLTSPYNKEPATIGNGVMIALTASDRETVDKVYRKALELGGTCEGKPGLREPVDMGFYAGYFRDLDGNKLNAFCMGT